MFVFFVSDVPFCGDLPLRGKQWRIRGVDVVYVFFGNEICVWLSADWDTVLKGYRNGI